MATLTLDPMQSQAIDEAVQAIRRRQPDYRIAGYAGTGKSTIMQHIVRESGLRIKTCAYTGKASNVLRQKGLKSSETIHRTMYEWDDHDERFFKRPSLECDAVAVDEGSMVPVPIWRDLQSYHIPIIVVGDPGQLEPIGEDAKLMHETNITLEKIHRYEGSIAWFANYVRTHDGKIPTIENEEVSVRSKSQLMRDLDDADVDIYLCGFNKTRVAMNRRLRELRFGVNHQHLINPGEKLIFLHNDRDLGVFNGQMGEVICITGEGRNFILVDIQLDDERIKHNLRVWNGHFHQPNQMDWRRFPKGMAIADYGYATTVHKFQGSEEYDVAVIDEQCDLWEPVRHRYTGFTRARTHLRVYVD
jgi:exodeoxyribonuclease-5